MPLHNVYEDALRAETYARLEFPGTYYLAYRDLPELIADHVRGRRALDFGCGTGRSTRFLQELCFQVSGVDISPEMIRLARERDPEGDYRLMERGNLSAFEAGTFDLILSAFTFDNIPTREEKAALFGEIQRTLNTSGKMINLVSSPEIYTHEWASFSTRDFPENARAVSGDPVKIIITATEDKRPVVDVVWSDEDYRRLYREAGLKVAVMHKPLAKESEPYAWINETHIAPWVIYVLGKEVK
jgi:ubiquinone/menaquinone biosynthesis C-methylase UbiE